MAQNEVMMQDDDSEEYLDMDDPEEFNIRTTNTDVEVIVDDEPPENNIENVIDINNNNHEIDEVKPNVAEEGRVEEENEVIDEVDEADDDHDDANEGIGDNNLLEVEQHADEREDIAPDPGADIGAEMDRIYGPRNNNYNLRPRRPRDYSHLHATLEHIALTQYSLKRGLAEFGSAGVEAVEKELQQLHERDVLIPVKGEVLGVEGRSKALPYLMFLKQKRRRS